MENYLTSTETNNMENCITSTETKEDTKNGRPVCYTSVCCLEFVLYSYILNLFCWGV